MGSLLAPAPQAGEGGRELHRRRVFLSLGSGESTLQRARRRRRGKEVNLTLSPASGLGAGALGNGQMDISRMENI